MNTIFIEVNSKEELTWNVLKVAVVGVIRKENRINYEEDF